MKKKLLQNIKLLSISIVILFIYSCQKENLNSENQNFNNDTGNAHLIDGWIAEGKIVFAPNNTMNKPLPKQVAWGVGASNRVFKSVNGGVTWTEPNPTARLKQISVGDSGVWGISVDNKIWKYNGTSWYQPNPSAGASQISASSAMNAWVVASAGNVYATNNGGSSWYPQDISMVGPLTQVTSGYYNNAYGINTNSQLVRFNFSTNKFDLLPVVGISDVSAGTLEDVWCIGANNRIFYSLDYGDTWTEPNTSASAYQISTYAFSAPTYSIGSSNRIFKTLDNGVNWTEPNPSAGLFKISCGIEY